MPKQRLPSLNTFARKEDPFAELAELKKRLLRCSSESRYLEWKSYAPIGPTVDTRSKYRAVKAAISFANTEGGFILFGIAPDGHWIGLTSEEMSHVDPSKITELINGCISPDLPYLNYAQTTHKGKHFAILHVPESPLLPHVTTKEIVDRSSRSKPEVILARHAVYYRCGGKSSLASPGQHQRIVAKRTDFLRTELLRRIREVPVAIPRLVKGSQMEVEGSVTYARVTDDPKAPAIRLTRDITQASGVFLHEQLSDGLFSEINNVLEANSLLSAGRNVFLLGEPVYFRIYAERQHVKGIEHLSLLARTALINIYGPYLFWFIVMPAEMAASIIIDTLKQLKAPYVNSLIRLTTLLGNEISDWLWELIDELWKHHRQKPDYYWSFEKIRNRKGTWDPRLQALRATGRSTVDIPSESGSVTFDEAMKDSRVTTTWLSQVCMKVFHGEKQWRGSARVLDVLAYGSKIKDRSSEILKQVKGYGDVKLSLKEKI